MTYKYLVPFTNSIVNIPMGLAVSVTSNTTLSIADGLCMDEEYTQNIFVDSPIAINTATVGAGGIDTGTLAASSLYYVYLMLDSTGNKAVTAVASLSATAPIYAGGYDKKKLIGVAITDGSTHFINLVQTGSGFIREYWFDTTVSVLSGGSSATFADVDLTGLMPVTACVAKFNASFTPAVAADVAYLSIGGSSSTNGVVQITGVVAAKAQSLQVAIPVGVHSSKPVVQYKVTASGALTLLLASFTHNLE